MKQRAEATKQPRNSWRQIGHLMCNENGWGAQAGKRFTAVVLTAVLCVVVLSGCEDFFDELADLLRINGSDVEAQGETTRDRIETFEISFTTFSIRVDQDGDTTPTVDVMDNATIYTMQSNVRAEFTLTTGEGRGFDLEIGDRLIARPGAGTLTIVQEN